MKTGGISLTTMAAMPSFANASNTKKNNDAPNKLTILFQGDSITDAGRDKASYYANDAAGMGRGYVFQIVSHLLGANPGKDWKYYNRGISGHKVFQLADRWDDDCLQLKPDVLSILIGVNDFWHTLNNYKGTVATYEADFRKLLDTTLKAFPNIKLIIGEPFAVKGGTAINESWFPEFPKYQQSARKVAGDYKAVFVPYQKIFDDALQLAPAAYWCPDGVHPSMAGGFLMKEAWIRAFEKLY
jgi:lysophospholipase L1-like esterase